MGQRIYAAEACFLPKNSMSASTRSIAFAAPPDASLYAQPLFKAQDDGWFDLIPRLLDAAAASRSDGARHARRCCRGALARPARDLLDRPGHCPSRGVGPPG